MKPTKKIAEWLKLRQMNRKIKRFKKVCSEGEKEIELWILFKKFQENISALAKEEATYCEVLIKLMNEKLNGGIIPCQK